jgi:hypothetical protein
VTQPVPLAMGVEFSSGSKSCQLDNNPTLEFIGVLIVVKEFTLNRCPFL